jgi:hypothetical protein
MKRTTEITFEVEETSILHPDKVLAECCPRCQALTTMVSPHAIALLTGASEREIFRRVEAGEIHFIETDCVFVCLSCIPIPDHIRLFAAENKKEN